ncbi:MAG: ribonuclease J [Candidatus Cryosericum sp.]|nr:ribonuclease J [bacterium]
MTKTQLERPELNNQHHDTIRITPLGGLGEIGKNMTVYEVNDDAIIVDAGFKFPEYDMQGIDYVIPNLDYLDQIKDKLRGIIITHSHMDHIGALGYVLERVRVPIYASKFALGIIEDVIPGRMKPYETVAIQAGDRIKIGRIDVEFIRVTHSVPESMAIAIRTSEGIIVHTGDYKIDQTPVDDKPIDLQKFSALGREGILLLLSDSTNAEESGFAGSERDLRSTFDGIVHEAKGRIIFSTFSSNIHRIQQIMDAVAPQGRKVLVDGRSIVSSVKVARKVKILEMPENMFVQQDEMASIPKDKMLIVTTGTQGEPMSGLSRLARGEHDFVKITKGDTVVLSADPIPGNEEMVARTVDNLFRRGANVFYRREDKVHVSGHGAQGDLKLMLSLTRPKFFVPIHGEYRHLVWNKRLAESIGMPPSRVFILENGQTFAVDREHLTTLKRVPAEGLLIDGLALGLPDSPILTDRARLAKDGILVAVVSVDRMTGKTLAGPEIATKGVVTDDDAMLTDLAREMKSFMTTHRSKEAGTAPDLQLDLRRFLTKYIYDKTRRRPIVIPVILER